MTKARHPENLVWMRSVLERFEGPLTRYAARVTGDVESARDVVQETFLRLCNQDRGAVDGHLAEWLFTVCRNRALDVRRKESRMRPLDEAAVKTHEADDPLPEALAESNEATSDVLRALASLPQNQQEVIRLRFQNSLSYREIASVTDLSVSNVGYLIHTAIKTIREKLGTGPGASSQAVGDLP
ncbi:MAG: sigma-70 family RNA polymerase sigma factor [Phycisphaerales bacterium]|nr:MAG: sigma-70 family RNA polymerase sigma factor [Phycisphaerales bacterium]